MMLASGMSTIKTKPNIPSPYSEHSQVNGLSGHYRDIFGERRATVVDDRQAVIPGSEVIELEPAVAVGDGAHAVAQLHGGVVHRHVTLEPDPFDVPDYGPGRSDGAGIAGEHRHQQAQQHRYEE